MIFGLPSEFATITPTEVPNMSLSDTVLLGMLLLSRDMALSIVPVELIRSTYMEPRSAPPPALPGAPTTMSATPLSSISPITDTEEPNISPLKSLDSGVDEWSASSVITRDSVPSDSNDMTCSSP